MAEYLNYDTEQRRQEVLTALEIAFGMPLFPGNEIRLFGEAYTALSAQVYAAINDAIKQSRLRYARGEKLDDIGDDRGLARNRAQRAQTTIHFEIEEAQKTNTIIPAGTRVTGLDRSLYFETAETAVLQAGETSIDITAYCTTPGEAGNHIPAQALNILVDVSSLPEYRLFTIYNTVESFGGSDDEIDESYRERIREFANQFSTAGPAKAYRFWALSADDSIADVLVVEGEETVERKASVHDQHAFFNGRLLHSISFDKEGDYEILQDDLIDFICSGQEEEVTATITRALDGVVKIIPICKGGVIPSQDILDKVYKICTQPDIKPLTDYVVVEAPEVVKYDIELKYYCTSLDENAVIANVEGDAGAIKRYVEWQDETLNQDINPDMLERLILAAEFDEEQRGAYRVDIVKPEHTKLKKNQIAKFSGSLKVSHEVKYDV